VKLRICHCPQCRSVLKYPHVKSLILRSKRAARHKVKQQLHMGKWDEAETRISIPYLA
jgi:hypothetical protein